MSLVDQSLPAGEMEHSGRSEDSQQTQNQQKSSYRDSLPGAPQPIYNHDTLEDSIFADLYNMMGQAPLKSTETVSGEHNDPSAPPALPARSALRTSRLLDGFGLRLGTPQPASLTHTTPHDVYLSSEEDGSSSADDFSDYDYDLEDAEEEQAEAVAVEVTPASAVEASPKSPMRRRRSHEDTARVVSVVFVGRPVIITVSPSRRSISPDSIRRTESSSVSTSTSSSAQHSREPSPSSSARRRSTSSVSTATTTTSASFRPHPARTSSKTEVPARTQPPFLSIDPFATSTPGQDATATRSVSMPAPTPGNPAPIAHDEHEPPRTPKTPTAMFKRTMSLVRKRSRPSLHPLAAASASATASTHSLPIVIDEAASTGSAPPTPVTYNDIIKSARRNAAPSPVPTPTSAAPAPMSPIPQSPSSPAFATSPAGTTRRVFSFAMGRRRSVKTG